MYAITAINDYAFRVADSIASTAMNHIMQIIGSSFIVVLPLLVLYMFARRDTKVFALVLAGVVLYIVSDTIKLIVREPRPCSVPELSWINAPACESSFSFPSNHASVLTGLAFFINDYKYIRIVYIAWLLLVLFGRIYLGLHYFTDVIAGAVISIIISYIILIRKELVSKVSLKLLPFLKTWFKK